MKESIDEIVDDAQVKIGEMKIILSKFGMKEVYDTSGCEINFSHCFDPSRAQMISALLSAEIGKYDIQVEPVERTVNKEDPRYSISLYSKDGPSKELLIKYREKYHPHEHSVGTARAQRGHNEVC